MLSSELKKAESNSRKKQLEAEIEMLANEIRENSRNAARENQNPNKNYKSTLPKRSINTGATTSKSKISSNYVKQSPGYRATPAYGYPNYVKSTANKISRSPSASSRSSTKSSQKSARFSTSSHTSMNSKSATTSTVASRAVVDPLKHRRLSKPPKPLSDQALIEKQNAEIISLENQLKELSEKCAVLENSSINMAFSPSNSANDFLKAVNDIKQNLIKLSSNISQGENTEAIDSINDSLFILQKFTNLVDNQENNIKKLKEEAVALNTNLANVTLLCDDEHIQKVNESENNEKEIERLQKLATDLNGSLARVTLLCDEIQQKNIYEISELRSEIEGLKQAPVISQNIQSGNNTEVVENLRNNLVKINQQLANVTLLCDEAEHVKNVSIRNLQDKIEYYKNMAVDLNRKIINLTTYCDELEKATPADNNKISNDCATIASQNKFITELQQQLANSRSVSKISDDCATISELMKQLNELKQQQPVSREIVVEKSVSKISNDCATIANQNKELLLKDQEIEQLKQQIQRLSASKIENDCATIASQNKIIEQQANEIKALKEQIANMKPANEKITNDCATIASQNQRIAELESQLKSAQTNNKIADDCATIKELMKERNAPKIDSDCATIANQNGIIMDLQKTIKSKKDENETLESNNEVLTGNIKDLETILGQLRISYFAERNKSDNLVNTIVDLKKENKKLSTDYENLKNSYKYKYLAFFKN